MRKINKKAIALLAIVLLATVIGIIIIITFKKEEKDLNQKEKLEDLFETMVIEYYENFYYNQIGKTQEERELFLNKYKSTGIQINLDSLSRYNSEVNNKRIEEFVNLDTNKKCDLINTISIIYPKEPFNKDSYEIKIKLNCGFEKERKK